MGNAVLMPEFYGIGIRRSPNPNLPNHLTQEPVEIRRLNYRSTYDDWSDSSWFTNQAESRVLEVEAELKKEENALFNTQESFHTKIDSKKTILRKAPQGDISLQLHTAKKQPKSQEADPNQPEQHENVNDRSLIDILTEIQDTPSEKEAIKQKCSVLYEMGKYAWKNGWVKETINYFEEVLKESAATFPPSLEEKAQMLCMMGNCYLRIERYEASLEKYREALGLLGNMEGNVVKCADIHMIVGTIYQKMKNFEKAIEHFQSSYQMKKAAQPRSKIDLLAPLSHIALAQNYKGNHLKAIERYCQTLAINRQIYGNSHIEVARNFYNLAISLFAVGEYSLWLEYHYNSLRMMKDLKLQRHPDYDVWLRWFKNKLREMMKLQSYAQEVVGRSINMASMLLTEEEQIEFLSGIKEDIEGSIVSSKSV